MSKKISVILVLLGILFTIIGSTISYIIWRSSEEKNTLITFIINSDYTCSADGGGNITSSDVILIPTEVNDNTVGNYIKREVNLYPSTSYNVNIYMDLWLNVNQIDSGLSNSTYFMYAFTTGSTGPTDGIVVSGNFNGTSAGSKINLLNDKSYSLTTTDTYYLWIWLDAEETDSATMNQSFSLSLGGSCTDSVPFTVNKLLENANPSTLSYTDATDTQKKEMWTFSHDATEQVPATTDYRYIGGEYCSYESSQYYGPVSSYGTCPERYSFVATSKSDGSTFTITNYSYCPLDTSSYTYECTELTLDGIVGVEPNNYITYNDEVWRIIGVFDGRIKIIRDESIDDLMWDYKQSGVGSSTTNYGSNDWTDSQLMYMLNPTSYKLKDGYTVTDNMIYDASSNIIYQLGCTPAKIATGATTYRCTTNNYSLNETALSQIDVVTYYLGGSSSASGKSAESYYTFERGTTVYSGRPTSWTGLVGLMYPSDYAYTFANGVDDKCYINTYNCSAGSGGTPSSSWLYNGANQWTISPFSDIQYDVFFVSIGGPVGNLKSNNSYGARLVVYLRSDIQLVGTGESSNPYTIIS